jgi:hypothetical protein
MAGRGVRHRPTTVRLRACALNTALKECLPNALFDKLVQCSTKPSQGVPNMTQPRGPRNSAGPCRMPPARLLLILLARLAPGGAAGGRVCFFAGGMAGSQLAARGV